MRRGHKKGTVKIHPVTLHGVPILVAIIVFLIWLLLFVGSNDREDPFTGGGGAGLHPDGRWVRLFSLRTDPLP